MSEGVVLVEGQDVTSVDFSSRTSKAGKVKVGRCSGRWKVFLTSMAVLVIALVLGLTLGRRKPKDNNRTTLQAFDWNTTLLTEKNEHIAITQLGWTLDKIGTDRSGVEFFDVPLSPYALLRELILHTAAGDFKSTVLPKEVGNAIGAVSSVENLPSAILSLPIRSDMQGYAPLSAQLKVSLPFRFEGTVRVVVVLEEPALLQAGWRSVNVVDGCGLARHRVTQVNGHLSFDGASVLGQRFSVYGQSWSTVPIPLNETQHATQWQVHTQTNSSRFLQDCDNNQGVAAVWQYQSMDYDVVKDFTWQLDEKDGSFLHRFVFPTLDPVLPSPLPRNVVLLLDTDTSLLPLWPVSLFSARRLLAQLTISDRFNIVPFTHHAGLALFPEPLLATDGNKQLALQFLAEIEVGGASNIEQALEAASLGLRKSAERNVNVSNMAVQPTIVLISDCVAALGMPLDMLLLQRNGIFSRNWLKKDLDIHGTPVQLHVVNLFTGRWLPSPDFYLHETSQALLAYGGGLWAMLNASAVSESCADANACKQEDIATLLQTTSAMDLTILNTMLRFRPTSLLFLSLNYSMPTAYLASSLLSTHTLASDSEVFVFGRMRLPGEIIEIPSVAKLSREEEQFISLREIYSEEMGPLSLLDFQNCDPRDVEHFLAKVSLHHAGAFRKLYLADNTQPNDSTTDNVNNNNSYYQPTLPFPPSSINVSLEGRGLDGVWFRLEHTIQHKVSAPSKSMWEASRLLASHLMVNRSGVEPSAVAMLRPSFYDQESGATPLSPTELALEYSIVSPDTVMAVAAVPADRAGPTSNTRQGATKESNSNSAVAYDSNENKASYSASGASSLLHANQPLLWLVLCLLLASSLLQA
eukprot:g30229.t1